jgi:hypothetical protein
MYVKRAKKHLTAKGTRSELAPQPEKKRLGDGMMMGVVVSIVSFSRFQLIEQKINSKSPNKPVLLWEPASALINVCLFHHRCRERRH